MQNFQRAFIKFAMAQDVLRFGEFTLKSGRKSPYFFNAGQFQTGECLAELGSFYAEAIQQAELDFDLLFGPAYKGIPIVSATAVALWRDHRRSLPWCFNRKEAKDHGEGGLLVGAPLQGRVLVVDDVITAGTAIRDVMEILQQAGAEAAGVVVALDRQEKGRGELSAIQEVERDFGIPVVSVITLADLVTFLTEETASGALTQFQSTLADIHAYREQYGI